MDKEQIRERIKRLDPTMQEFLKFGVRLGLFDTKNIDRIVDLLEKSDIVYVDNIGGGQAAAQAEDKENGGKSIKVCKEVIEREANGFGRNLDEYFEETMFHELTHAIGPKSPNSIKEKIRNMKSDSDKEKFDEWTNSQEFIYDYLGWEVVDEIMAQSVAQAMIKEKYQKEHTEPIYQTKHSTFKYNEYGKIPDEEAYSFEYTSDLFWYGEIEQFALDFLKALYGKADANVYLKDYADGNFLEKIFNEYGKRKGGLDNLYKMMAYMGNIVVCDYNQQGYYGDNAGYANLDVPTFKNAVEQFEKLVELEKDRLVK